MLTGLIIKDNTYLKQKGIKYLELDLRDVLTIILGRNGFGKTTLMRSITPMPPDNADYGPDGYKEWRFVDDRGTYVLKSKTGKNSHHEFIYNGVNLNEGNTLLVQKELVKIHFGITQQIVNVLTGLDVRDLFTTMSTARRKDFLMTINPNDTTYALKIFEKLKSNYNTIRGGLKTQRQRLVVEESRLKDLAGLDTESLHKEIRALDDQIKEALVLHGELSHVQLSDIRPLHEEMKNIISRLLAADKRIKMGASQYNQHLTTLSTRVTNRNNFLSKLTGAHQEITQQLQGLDVSTQNLDGYKRRIGLIADTLAESRIGIEVNEMFFSEHPHFMEDEFFRSEAVVLNASEMVEQLRLVHKARDPEATSEKFKQAQEKSVEYKNNIANLEAEITQINHSLRHFNNAENVNCPECNVQFKIGFEKFNPKELENRRDENILAKEQFVQKLQRCTDYIDANEEWYSSMAGFMRYVRRLKHSTELLNLTQKYNVGKSDTTVLIECLRRAEYLDKTIKQFSLLEEEMNQLEAQVKYLESSDINALFMRAEDIEREMAFTQRELMRTRTEIKETEAYINTIMEDGHLRDRLTEITDELLTRLHQNGLYGVKRRVKNAIDDMSPRKEQLMSNLIRAESLNSVIQSIKDNIVDLERREKHTLLLMDGLSPVKGLIGYLMNDFLKAVVGNMNSILQQIWTTRFRVLNCSTSKTEEDVELNYLFPAITGDESKPSKDVGDCSGGEREMINFTFRLVILRYLGAKCGVPLMMDEVGVALDSLHRGRFNAWVDEQYRTDMLPKTFMISHDYAQFGSNNSANFIGLNTEGLKVPLTLNDKSIVR